MKTIAQAARVTGVTTYAYNAHGALVQQTDAWGVLMIRQLDPADRPTQVTYRAARRSRRLTATTPPLRQEPTKGCLFLITKGSGGDATVVAYTYDLLGRTLIFQPDQSLGARHSGWRKLLSTKEKCNHHDHVGRVGSVNG